MTGTGNSYIIPLETASFVLLLLLYVFIGGYMEHKKAKFGHITGVALLIGLAISALMYFLGNGKVTMPFNDTIFFQVCLPPVIFASGFNMRRKRFFENIGYILVFGILGAFVCFIVYSGLNFLLMNYGNLTMYVVNPNPAINSSNWQSLELTFIECMVISSILCSSDVIAAISIVNQEEQPKLFSIIFGEGVVNDAVAIILFQSVANIASSYQNVPISNIKPTVFLQVIQDFFILAITSLVIGVILGLLASYQLKRMRYLTVSSINETLVIFFMGYLTYAVGELAQMSGIICLLTSGIVMAHYAWYNLSPQGKVISSATIQIIGFGFEAFIFASLGLSYFNYIDLTWSWQLILAEVAIVLIGRFIGTVGLIYFFSLFGHKRQLSFRQLCFVCYGGLIRGAIPFGLVLQLDSTLVRSSVLEVIQTTTLTMVLFTTLLFGSTMQMVQKLLIPNIEEAKILNSQEKTKVANNQNSQIFLNGGNIVTSINEQQSPHMKSKHFISQSTKTMLNQAKITNEMRLESFEHYELFLHPNMDKEKEKVNQGDQRSEPLRDKKKGCGNRCTEWFLHFDKTVMKPFFIYKYDADQRQKKGNFVDLFMKDAVVWEQAYEEEEENADVKEVEEKQIQVQGASVFEKIRSATKRNLNYSGKRRSSLTVSEDNPLFSTKECEVKSSRTATQNQLQTIKKVIQDNQSDTNQFDWRTQ